MLKQCSRLIDPWDRLLIHIFKRSFQHDCSVPKKKKGYNSIRKENDIHTAEYYFENGKIFDVVFQRDQILIVREYRTKKSETI
jgi:hypothetical protein